jgi:hypothetical protein
MKTSRIRQWGLGLAAGLILFLGCARHSAETEQPKTVSAPSHDAPTAISRTDLRPAAPTQSEPIHESSAAAGETNAPTIVERIDPVPAAPNLVVSTGLAEVVRLSQGGLTEDVILAFIEKHPGKFEVGADQILYLNDLGVSPTVITALLKHDGSDLGLLTNAPTLVQTQAVSNVPAQPVNPAPPAPESAPAAVTATAPPPTSSEVAYFYDTLAPYGSWVYVSGYGWCWQPTVAVTVSTWRPYCDRGRWYWSDAGWYWHSDYSWGWATFHYGRWYQHPRAGWLWRPGLAWAPSWVSWRYYDGYCGWAPLPPEAHYVSGVGFTYYGRNVSIGFDFGLRVHHYAFVPLANFCDYAPYRYVVPHGRVHHFYHRSRVENHYVADRHRGFVNHGIGRETVARASQTRVREVAIRETAVRHPTQVRGDRIDKEGDRLVAVRPKLPDTPPAVRTANFAQRSNAGGRPENVSRISPNRATAQEPPGASMVNRGGFGRGQSTVARENSSAGAAQENRTPDLPNEARRAAVPNETRRVTESRNGRGSSVENPTRIARNNASDPTTSPLPPARVSPRNSSSAIAQPNRVPSQNPANDSAAETVAPRGTGPLFGNGQNNGGSRPVVTPRTEPAPRVNEMRSPDTTLRTVQPRSAPPAANVPHQRSPGAAPSTATPRVYPAQPAPAPRTQPESRPVMREQPAARPIERPSQVPSRSYNAPPPSQPRQQVQPMQRNPAELQRSAPPQAHRAPAVREGGGGGARMERVERGDRNR